MEEAASTWEKAGNRGGSRLAHAHTATASRALEERRRVRLRGVKRVSPETGFWKPRETTLNPQRWKKTWNHLTNYPHLFRLERDESCLWAGTTIVGPQTKWPYSVLRFRSGAACFFRLGLLQQVTLHSRGKPSCPLLPGRTLEPKGEEWELGPAPRGTTACFRRGEGVLATIILASLSLRLSHPSAPTLPGTLAEPMAPLPGPLFMRTQPPRPSGLA